MRFRALLPVVALCTLGTAVMHADTFNFSFGSDGDTIVGSGVLTGTLTGAGQYTITAITGTTSYPGNTDLQITGLLKANKFEGNDNLLLFSDGRFAFDQNGLSYKLSDATDVNLYEDEALGDAELYQTKKNSVGNEYVPYTVTAVTPEPSSLVLTGMGLLSAAGVVRRRF